MTDLERIKKDVVEMDGRANICWYDTKVLTKAVRLILEELTADRKTEPQLTPNYCGTCRHRDVPCGDLPCDVCHGYSNYEPKTEPQTEREDE